MQQKNVFIGLTLQTKSVSTILEITKEKQSNEQERPVKTAENKLKLSVLI